MGERKCRMQQRQTQQQTLRLTQTMRQALSVLQMDAFELTHYLQEISLENPLMDIGTQSTLMGNPEDVIDMLSDSSTISLPDYLMAQVGLLKIPDQAKRDVELLITQIDKRGYLTESDKDLSESLGFSSLRLARAKSQLQTLAPAGVGAQSLRECLLLQIVAHEGKSVSPIRALVAECFDDLSQRKWNKICQQLKISRDELIDCLKELHQLTANPGDAFESGRTEYVRPELRVRTEDGQLSLQLIKGAEPEVIFAHETYDTLRQHNNDDVQAYLRVKRHQFLEVSRACQRRQETMVIVGQAIVEAQFDYFLNSSNGLKVVTVREIAQRIGMNESTVSRAIRGKCIETQSSVIPLRSLLMAGQTSTASQITIAIQALVGRETKSLTDERIVELLKEQGYKVARRTVAKYRRLLGIPSASKRSENMKLKGGLNSKSLEVIIHSKSN